MDEWGQKYNEINAEGDTQKIVMMRMASKFGLESHMWTILQYMYQKGKDHTKKFTLIESKHM